MSLFKTLSDYRWPIYVGGLLAMSVISSGVLVYVATRPDAPRPIKGYYESARAWDADEAVEDASRKLGWTVTYELAAGVPYTPGMPRPIDVQVADRDGKAVTGLTGHLFAMRPSDARLNQSGALTEIPQQAGRYRTLVRIDDAGAWEFRIDTMQGPLRFVHAARITVAAEPAAPGGPSR